ncbi:Uncharacterised protein [Mycobacteroides abscessus subsp. abscessus]|nr:Uncharacterised protein [Mycobacteroides abscessus subsp. abscessus]
MPPACSDFKSMCTMFGLPSSAGVTDVTAPTSMPRNFTSARSGSPSPTFMSCASTLTVSSR